MIPIFRDDPYRCQLETSITSVRIHNPETALVSLREGLFTVGGGQPADHGFLIVEGQKLLIQNVSKAQGDIFLEVSVHPLLRKGTVVTAHLDMRRRYNIMRLHTAQHGLAAAAQCVLKAPYEQRSMQISDNVDFCHMRFMCPLPPSNTAIDEIDMVVRRAIAEERLIYSHTFANIQVAKNEWHTLFRSDPQIEFKGKVRLVIIDGLDANPCGGTHCRTMAEIDDIQIVNINFDEIRSEWSVSFRLGDLGQQRQIP